MSDARTKLRAFAPVRAFGPFGYHNDTHNQLNVRLDALERQSRGHKADEQRHDYRAEANRLAADAYAEQSKQVEALVKAARVARDNLHYSARGAQLALDAALKPFEQPVAAMDAQGPERTQ